MSDATCGFYAVNGKHCVINARCVVCGELPPTAIPDAPEPPKLKKGETITLVDFGPLDGTYRIGDIREGKLRLEFLE